MTRGPGCVVDGVAHYPEGRAAVDGGKIGHMVAIITEKRALLAVVHIVVDRHIACSIDDALGCHTIGFAKLDTS
mgnify:CR=1 FL=1